MFYGFSAAWLVVVSLFNVAIQIAVPAWVRARVLAVYMLVFAGGFSAGSAVWGAIATHQSLKAALLCSAGGLGLGLLAAIRYRVNLDDESDLTPSLHWPEPHLILEPRPEQGPVLVTMEYLIDPPQSGQFAQIMRALSVIRRRDGAIRWGLFQDTANPGRFLETFIALRTTPQNLPGITNFEQPEIPISRAKRESKTRNQVSSIFRGCHIGSGIGFFTA